ncbi:hypothetical protein MNQ98_23380 [Paenibacillus sp. N3/727]|uniref:hypothetical protein n=1 Tax=Paenibacillus sp. N3/727 TaxID=2925845 RepID=UPI001F532B02|nr:hypothetical protein [Paenibacillus sp. N3/727]UNK17390.1 hypothetical protein MNQ98_23380 [Paenibacillus sp. N3/727]
MTEVALNENDKMIRVIGDRELFFLMHMLESSGIAGFADPYRGSLKDELEEEWGQCKQNLLEAGLLIQKEDELEVEPVMEAFMAVMDSPYAMRLQIIRRGIPVYDGYMHMLPQMVIERIEDEEKRDTFRISAIANVQSATMFLEHVFPADSSEGPQGFAAPFTISEEVYDALLPDGEEAGTDMSMNETDTKRLKSMMDEATEHGRLTLLERRGHVWKQEMLTYGFGTGGGWIAKSDGEDGVQVENYRQGKMGQAMKAFVKELLIRMEAESEGMNKDEN